MLPSVRDARTVALRIIAYTLVLWALTLAVLARRRHGPALLLVRGRASAACSRGSPSTCCATTSPRVAMRLFGWSITYITLLFGAMAVDQLVRSGV